jgi:hypothetical protein
VTDAATGLVIPRKELTCGRCGAIVGDPVSAMEYALNIAQRALALAQRTHTDLNLLRKLLDAKDVVSNGSMERLREQYDNHHDERGMLFFRDLPRAIDQAQAAADASGVPWVVVEMAYSRGSGMVTSYRFEREDEIEVLGLSGFRKHARVVPGPTP